MPRKSPDRNLILHGILVDALARRWVFTRGLLTRRTKASPINEEQLVRAGALAVDCPVWRLAEHVRVRVRAKVGVRVGDRDSFRIRVGGRVRGFGRGRFGVGISIRGSERSSARVRFNGSG